MFPRISRTGSPGNLLAVKLDGGFESTDRKVGHFRFPHGYLVVIKNGFSRTQRCDLGKFMTGNRLQ